MSARLLNAISEKVQVHAAAAELATQVAEGQEFIRSNKDVNSLGTAGDGLDHIQLVRQLPAGSHSCQVLRFIDNDCCGAPVTSGIFK